MKTKHVFTFITGLISTFVIHYLGGWDFALQTLVMFIVIDYVTGMYVAGILHKSPKTKSGGLSSEKGFHGIIKKIMLLVFVAIMYRLDLFFNIDYLRNGTIVAYCVNELISIIENAGLMGVYVPDIVKRGIDLLNREVDNNED
jgi:toxin secretion/phage lysis holin